MDINKTCFSRNANWNKALTARAKLLFGADWKYDPAEVHQSPSTWGDCLSIWQGTKTLSWHRANDSELILWSGYKQDRHDPALGVPSFLRLYESGIVYQNVYCRDGSAHDPAPNFPAQTTFYPSGALLRTVHHKHGTVENPSKDVPAEVTYYETGKVREVRYFNGGFETDPECGMPSRIIYAQNGGVVSGRSSSHGLLSGSAATKMVAAAKKRLLSDLVGGSQIVALSAKRIPSVVSSRIGIVPK